MVFRSAGEISFINGISFQVQIRDQTPVFGSSYRGSSINYLGGVSPDDGKEPRTLGRFAFSGRLGLSRQFCHGSLQSIQPHSCFFLGDD